LGGGGFSRRKGGTDLQTHLPLGTRGYADEKRRHVRPRGHVRVKRETKEACRGIGLVARGSEGTAGKRKTLRVTLCVVQGGSMTILFGGKGAFQSALRNPCGGKGKKGKKQERGVAAAYTL